MKSFRLESNAIPVIVVLIAAFAILLVPFKIIGEGFLPPDDALWHSAKIISGKNWSEVLVLCDDIKTESHPGWHAVLGAVHKFIKQDALSLVFFSVISLFILFSLIPIFFLRRPESWLVSMLILSIAAPGWFFRLLLGRPFIFTMAALIAILFLWPKLKDKKINYSALAALIFIITLATWIHRTWYVLFIPVVAILFAREWRTALRMAICLFIGIFLGASLTGHPILFLKQTILHLFLVYGEKGAGNNLVSELLPTLGDFNIIIVVLGVITWRVLRKGWDRSIVDNPVFILAILSFVMGFITRRAWLDFGLPSIAVWMAKELDDFFYTNTSAVSLRRLFTVLALGGVLYLSGTTDAVSRWSACRPLDYLSSEDPEQAKWLPDPEGIIYSDNMRVFFQTVFKNPHGNWRYILGSEAAIMPKDDLAILRNIQQHPYTYKYFEPWVKKMRQEDRLIIGGNEDYKPKIEGLEWKYAAMGIWVGRKPQGSKK